MARGAVSDGTDTDSESSFDSIFTDPPYGIRESSGSSTNNRRDREEEVVAPLIKLVQTIAAARNIGRPLLREKGGRLVAFVPQVNEGENSTDLESSMPNNKQLLQAGLELSVLQEQPLSNELSRWLVVYKSKHNN